MVEATEAVQATDRPQDGPVDEQAPRPEAAEQAEQDELQAAARRARRVLFGARVEELPDVDLLARVLGSGFRRPQEALELASALLDSYGGLAGLAVSSSKALQNQEGMGLVRAGAVTAAFELALRVGPVEARTDVERWRQACPSDCAVVLGYGPDGGAPITLALERIDTLARPGSLLANCLASSLGPWSVIAWRPEGRIGRCERRAALEVLDIARLVGADLKVALLSPDEVWVVGELAR